MACLKINRDSLSGLKHDNGYKRLHSTFKILANKQIIYGYSLEVKWRIFFSYLSYVVLVDISFIIYFIFLRSIFSICLGP